MPGFAQGPSTGTSTMVSLVYVTSCSAYTVRAGFMIHVGEWSGGGLGGVEAMTWMIEVTGVT